MDTQRYWLNENVQGIVALCIIVIGFTFLKWAHATETINQGVKDLMFIVATFYFGGSRSSAKKDETIASLSQTQQPTIQQTGDNPIATASPQTDETKTP